MRWQKKGLIFAADGHAEWMARYAYVPVAEKISDDVIRIYFGTRDTRNRTVATFIEVEADNPANVLRVHDRPVLGLGRLGTFDDSGVTACSMVNHESRKYLFYVGWNQTVTVPYRNAIGVAVSDDGGLSFSRLFEGSILDRTKVEPYFLASPFCMIDDGKWKLWYTSSTGWTMVGGKPEPLYQIKYCESSDGVDWIRNNTTCIEYKFAGEANTRPCVLKENGLYRMWYCYRGSIDYRTDKTQSYRIGYAESRDGIKWARQDDEAGIERSEEGWDSLMMEYPYVYEHKGRKYMFYNGNGFGETGFGYAILDE